MDERSPLQLLGEPSLRDPTMILGYAGWSDAGDAATTAVRQLIEQLPVTRIARIDTEDFLDFTVVRPHVRLRDGREREIVWPTHEFFAGEHLGRGDLVLGIGVEPHLRWRAYARHVVELVRSLGIRRVILLGAYLDDVIYSQPTQVGVFSAAPDLVPDVDTGPPRYEGPTGIVGVLADAFRRERIPAVNLWARIPHYVETRPNFRGALALCECCQVVSGLRFDLSSLEEAAERFDETVSELIANDPQLTAYVRELKRRAFSQ